MSNQFMQSTIIRRSFNQGMAVKSAKLFAISRAQMMAKYSGFLATTCLVGLAVTQNKAMAAPTGGNVVGGNADITVSGSQTNINQSSNRAAIDWQSFSVAADESVNFTVPNGGATLNRVVGSQASLIQGRVSSNGSLYLVNPNGLVLDAGSQISAQNFIATTSNIDPAQFMTGDHVTLQKSSTNARISLKGTITVADRGVVGIFAPQVENQGTIIANLGSVVLAGSQASVIDFNGDGLINFELGASDGRTGESLLASNKGVINAAGGHVTLTAQGAESLFNAIVENSGNINATSLSAKGGTVTLKANLGSVNDSGTIAASGATGGGDVLVWASENAKFTGNIKAEALSNSQNIISNGGAVEVSGLKYLNFNGTVSTLSHNGGKMGSLLLDPTDIEIRDAAPSPAGPAEITVASNNFTGVGTNNTSYILTANLVAALTSNNVTVDATATGAGTGTGKITVTNDIIWGGTGDLTLKSGNGGIAINADITSNNATTRNLVLYSGGGITQDNTKSITVNDLSVQHNMGIVYNIVNGLDTYVSGDFQSIDLGGQNHINTISKFSSLVLQNAQYLETAFVTISNAQDLTINDQIRTTQLNYGTGILNLNVSGKLSLAGFITGTVNLNVGGDITLNNGTYISQERTYNINTHGKNLIINGNITLSDGGSEGYHDTINLMRDDGTDSGSLIFTKFDQINGSSLVAIASKLTITTNHFDFSNSAPTAITLRTGAMNAPTSFVWANGQKTVTGRAVVGTASAAAGLGFASNTYTLVDTTSFGSGFDGRKINATSTLGGVVTASGDVYIVGANSNSFGKIESTTGSIYVKNPTGSTTTSYFGSDLILTARQNIQIDAPITMTNNAALSLVSGGVGTNIAQSATGIITADLLNVNYSSLITIPTASNENMGTVNLTSANLVNNIWVIGGSTVNFVNAQDLALVCAQIGTGTNSNLTIDVGATHTLTIIPTNDAWQNNAFGFQNITLKGNKLAFVRGSFNNDNRSINSNNGNLNLNFNLAPTGLRSFTSFPTSPPTLFYNFDTGTGNIAFKNYNGGSLTGEYTGDVIVGSGAVAGVNGIAANAASYNAVAYDGSWASTNIIRAANANDVISSFETNQVLASGTIYVAVTANDGNLNLMRKFVSSGGNVVFVAGAANNFNPNVDTVITANATNKGVQFNNNVTFGARNVTITAGTGGITGLGTISVTNGNLTVNSGATLTLNGFSVSGSLGGSAAGAVTLNGNFGSLAAFTQSANGDFSVTSSKSYAITAPTRTNGAVGAVSYAVTGAGNTITLASNQNFGASNVKILSVAALSIGHNITTTGSINLISSSGGISGTATVTGANLTLSSAGSVNLTGLAISGAVSGSAAGAVALSGSMSALGVFTQTANGNFDVTNARSLVLSDIIRTNNAIGNIAITVTGTNNTLTLAKDVDYGNAYVNLSSDASMNLGRNLTTNNIARLNSNNGNLTINNAVTGTQGVELSGAIINGTGKVTTNVLYVYASDNVNLLTNVKDLREISVSNGKNFTLINDAALMINGILTLSAAASGTAGTLTLTTLKDGIMVGNTGSIEGNDLRVISAGAASLTNLTLTGTVSGTVAGAVTLGGAFGGFSGLQQTANGRFTINSTQNLTSLMSLATNRAAGVTGDIAFIVTGAGRTISLDRDYDFGANNVSFTSDAALSIGKNITTTGTLSLTSTGGGISTASGKKISATTLTGSAAGAVNLASNVKNLGAFTVNGTNDFTLINDGALTVTGAVAVGTGGLNLTTVTGDLALNAGISGGDVNLTATAGKISQSAALTASKSLTASAAGAIDLTGVNNNAISSLKTMRGAGVSINNSVALSLAGDITATNGTISIDNSFGNSATDKAISMGANVALSGGNVLLNLGGGTHSETHTASTGGKFLTNEFTLKTYSGTDTATAVNLTILAESFAYGTTAEVKYIDVGAAKVATVLGNAVLAANAQGVTVIGADYNDGKGNIYTVSQTSYANVLTGASLDATKVTGTIVATAPLMADVSVTGDIYVNGGATDYSSITSTGGRVYFVGNYTDNTGLMVNANKGIVISAAFNGGTGLVLNTSSGGITETGLGAITTDKITVNSRGGVALTGANLIGNLGDLSNSGGGNILIHNGKTTDVTANSTWSNNTGMITVKLTAGNLNLLGDMTIASTTNAVRIDLGSAAKITGTKTITAKNVDVYYSGAITGNDVKFNLGVSAAAVGVTPATIAGTFTQVIDKTPASGTSQTIDYLYNLSGDASSFLSLGAASGITIIGDNGVALSTQPTLGKGVRYADTVALTVNGNWNPAIVGNAGTLRWIEGGSIKVTSGNTNFSGSIVLAANGNAPSTPTITGNAYLNDLYANIYVAGNLAAAKDVILVQKGSVAPPALLASGKTASGASGADAYGIYVGGAVTAISGSVILSQSGAITANAGSASGIQVNGNVRSLTRNIDIYNAGAVISNQSATLLSVTAYGVKIGGAVIGGNLAANNVSITNKGDVAANSNADISTKTPAELAGKIVSATGVSVAGAIIGGNLSILDNANVTGGSTTSSRIPTVSGTGLMLGGVLLANAGKVTISHDGKVTGVSNATGIYLISATGTGVANVSRTTAGSTVTVTPGVTGGVSISESGNVTSSGATSAAKGIVVLGNVTGVLGKVEITQELDITGGVLASGITLAGVTSIGAVRAEYASGTIAAPITTNIAAVDGGISIRQNGNVAGNNGEANGIVAYGAFTAINGAVSVKSSVDAAGALTNKTVTAATGRAFGMNLLAPVTTVSYYGYIGDASITVSQNAAVTASANSATGLSLGVVVLANGANNAAINLANNGTVTANQSAANLSVSATGISTIYVYGGNLATNNVTITNSKAITANNLADSASITAAMLAGRVVSATGVNLGTTLSGGGLTISNTGDVSHGANSTAQKYAVTATGINMIGNQISGANQTVTQSGAMTGVSSAMGMNQVGLMLASKGNLTVQSSLTKEIKAENGAATGLMLGGVLLANAGKVTISHDGKVTGVTNATGIYLISATGTGVANVSRTTAGSTVTVTPGVTGGVSISESGNVTSSGATSAAKGIVVLGNVTGVLGKVEITQESDITGGVLASGITLAGVTSIGAVRAEYASGTIAAPITTNIAAVDGGISIRQNGNVAGNNGEANGIVAYGAFTAINGAVSVKSSVDAAGALTNKTVTAATGRAFGMNLLAPVTTVSYYGYIGDASITVSQNAAVTASANSATGLSLGVVVLANGANNAAINLANNGTVTANQSAANLSVSATGISTIYVYGGNLATNNVTITNSKAITANNLADSASITAAMLAGRVVSATGVNLGTTLSGGGLTISNTGDVSHGANSTAQKYAVTATGINMIGNQISGANQTVTQSGAMTGVSSAMGMNQAGLMLASKGNLTVQSSLTKEIKAENGAATGLMLGGVLLANAGKVTISHDGKVTGVTNATGIYLISATGTGVANVSRTTAGSTVTVTPGVTGGVSISESGNVTSSGATSAAKGIVVLGNVTGVLGKVEITQESDITGGVLASGITLAGVTSIGAVRAEYASGTIAAPITTNIAAVDGGISIRQNGNVAGNNGEANGIVAYGAFTAINGAVSVKSSVDAAGALTNKTVTAATGRAFGMNLLAPVTTVSYYGYIGDASITISQNAAVTASANSATGLSLGVVVLANGANNAGINLANNGTVTANQSAANLSVSATGISTIYVYGGNLATNNVAITNSKAITANNLADSASITAAMLAGRVVSATGVNLGTTLSGGGLTISNTGDVSHGANSTAQKYAVTATGINMIGNQISGANQTVTQSGAMTGVSSAMGMNQAGLMLASKGNLTVQSSLTKEIKAENGAATGLMLGGVLLANAGKVTISHDGKVTGVSNATGIYLISATGTGVANVSRTTAGSTVTVTPGVTGGVSISESGNVTSSGATSAAKGIVVLGNVTGVLGKVEITQESDITGGVLASGITLAGVTSIGAVRAEYASGTIAAPITTNIAAVDGGISIRQNGNVAGNNGEANGIVAYGAFTAINGAVSVKSSVDAAGALTNKTVTAATGRAFGMNLLAPVTTVSYYGYIGDASITVSQNAAVTASANSATGLSLGVVVLANGANNAAINLANNGTVTANQSVANLSVSATGISTIYVYGGNLATNNVTITNSKAITANNLAGSNITPVSVDIKTLGPIIAAVSTLTLNAVGNIDASGAAIIAKTVTATSSGTTGKVTLNNAGNVIANFGAISAGSFDVGSAIAFNLTGNLTQTSTASGAVMKISNYGFNQAIGISASNINANRAGGNQLSFGFRGAGQFLTNAAQGKIVYVDAGAAATDLTVTILNNRITTPQATGVKVTRN